MENSIRKQLARLMRERRLSQSALSRGAGVPQPTINRILSQTTLDLRRDSVVRIAKFLNVTPEYLYNPGSDVSAKTEPFNSVEPAAIDQVDDICRQVMTLTSLQRSEVLHRLLELVVVK